MAVDNTIAACLASCAAYQRDVALAYIDMPSGEWREARLAEALTQQTAAYTEAALAMLQQEMADASAAQQTALRRLRAWCLDRHVQHALLPQQRDIQSHQRATACVVDGEPIPLLQSFAAMAAETRRERRAAIEAAVGEELGPLNELFAAQFETRRRLAQQLGYASPVAMWEEIALVDLTAQQEMATRILAETQEVYVDLLTWALKQRLRLPLGQLKRHDILALFTFSDYQSYYQPGMLVPCLQRCLGDMGLDPRVDGRLLWRERPIHLGPPMALPVQVPGEIVLSYAPIHGLQGTEAFAQAYGRALLWAHTAPDSPLLARLLGDEAIAASNGQWLAEMVAHPLWLHHYAAVTADRDYRLWRRLDWLYRLRRQLGRFLYTQHLYAAESLAGVAETYRDIMMDACHVDYLPEYYLLDGDWSYETLPFWRGAVLASALRETLREQLGEEWFRQPETGEWLSFYWSGALAAGSDESLQRLTSVPWDVTLFVEPLLEELDGW